MTFVRRTVVQECVFEGLGLHSGEPTTVRVLPGEGGIVFRHGMTSVVAEPANVTDTSRCTTLGEIRTIEHLMSAFAATGITDAVVELTYPELPGLDGSSVAYYQSLSAAGLVEIGEREIEDIYTRIFLQEGDIKIAVGKGTGHWRFDFITGERWPGEQSYDCPTIVSSYGTEVAPARTTVFAEEIEMAQKAGLGRGLDESSVLILGAQGYENEARFVDEPARHKLLDLIGDLYLSGVPIDHLNVVGTRSGHRWNVEMARRMVEATRKA
ncbi:MAG: UDP-3-O-acyl-N-acetylglucosamine deacetylase [Armatimonadetes bacterium]|nr:UDP-3-O-acyl-N-acetylglucosamine deacetylase [Armatimonadota bacterium]